MAWMQFENRRLRFHFYAILAASMWAALETYISMLFGELYVTRPELLKSSQTITFADAIDHEAEIRAFLAARQLSDLGHFTPDQLFVYMNDRLKISVPDDKRESLKAHYLVRNIVSHATGIIRPNQIGQLPNGIAVSKNEMRVSRKYLRQLALDIDAVVVFTEKAVVRKFYKKTAKTPRKRAH